MTLFTKHQKQTASFGQLFTVSCKQFFPTVFGGILYGMMTGLGAMAYLIPGILIATVFSIYLPIILFEKQSILSAFASSFVRVKTQFFSLNGYIAFTGDYGTTQHSFRLDAKHPCGQFTHGNRACNFCVVSGITIPLFNAMIFALAYAKPHKSFALAPFLVQYVTFFIFRWSNDNMAKDIELQEFTPYKEAAGEEYMKEKQRKHFETILNDWKTNLMAEVDRTVNHMQDEAANFPDMSDRATQEEEFSLELRTRDRERKLIRKINQSLEAIQNNDYGYCDSFEIGIRRLEARPTATLCIDCKTLSEIKEKQLYS